MKKHQADTFSFTLKKQEVICGKCNIKFEDNPKRSFLGFLVFTCPKCAEKTTYPLTAGYKLIYWLVVISLLLQLIGAIPQGTIFIPGLFGIGAIIGLVKDHLLRKRIKESNENFEIKYCKECGNKIH